MDPTPGRSVHPIISEFANDPDMVELVELFVGELPARIRALEAAWSEQRVLQVARIAHQLKGSGAGYGFPAIGHAAGSLEERLREAADADAAAALQRVSDEFKQLIETCSRACRTAA